MSKNNISEIDSGAFENCVNITMLNMSYNSISDIQNTVFDNISYATVWQLSYNNLTDMSQVSLPMIFLGIPAIFLLTIRLWRDKE